MTKNNIGQLQQELNMYIVSGNDAGADRIQSLIDSELKKLSKEKAEDSDE